MMFQPNTHLFGLSYSIIALFITAVALTPLMLKFITSDKLNKNNKSKKKRFDPKGIVTISTLSISILLATMVLLVIAIGLLTFVYFYAIVDEDASQSLTLSLQTLSTIFWNEGNLTFAYVSIAISIIVTTIILLLYATTHKEFTSTILKSSKPHETGNQVLSLISVITMFCFILVAIPGHDNTVDFMIIFISLLMIAIFAVLSRFQPFMWTIVYATIYTSTRLLI